MTGSINVSAAVRATTIIAENYACLADGNAGDGTHGFWFTNSTGSSYTIMIDTTSQFNQKVGVNGYNPSANLTVYGTALVKTLFMGGTTNQDTATAFQVQSHDGTQQFIVDTLYGGVNINAYICPVVDSSGSGSFGIWNAAGTSPVLTFDTTNQITYPVRLVIPTS